MSRNLRRLKKNILEKAKKVHTKKKDKIKFKVNSIKPEMI